MEEYMNLEDKWIQCKCCNKHFLFPAYPKDIKTKQEALNYINDFIFFCMSSPEDEDMVDVIDFDNQFSYQFFGISKDPELCTACSRKEQEKEKTISKKYYI